MAHAHLTDPTSVTARRILLIGVTGSGKTSLARALEASHGIRAIDVDSMAWQPGWVKTPDEELAASAAAVAATDAWVMDSAWTAIRSVVLPRTELVVALDLPRRVSLGRLLTRTTRRLITRERICGDNVESLHSVLSRDSIIRWHFRSFAEKRAQIAEWESDPALPPVLRLRSPREVHEWLDTRSARMDQ